MLNKEIYHIIEIEGDLDFHSADIFLEEFIKSFDEIKNFILDCSKLKFIDSSGMGILTQIAYERYLKKEAKIKIINLNKGIDLLFERNGLFNLIEKFNSEKEAINSFGHPTAKKTVKRIKVCLKDNSENKWKAPQ